MFDNNPLEYYSHASLQLLSLPLQTVACTGSVFSPPIIQSPARACGHRQPLRVQRLPVSARRGVCLDRDSYIRSSLGFRSLDRDRMAQFPFGQQGHQQTSGQVFDVQWRHCYPHLSVTPLSAGACYWQPGPSSYHVGAQTPISVSIVPLRRTRAGCDVWLMPCALFRVAISIPSMTLRSYALFPDSRSSYTPIPRTRVLIPG